jgi:hypothetical protein
MAGVRRAMISSTALDLPEHRQHARDACERMSMLPLHAYRLAWCDGPPFAYDYGLRTARAHLQTLGVPEPDMPPYDPSKHERIEEIPIDPPDEEE